MHVVPMELQSICVQIGVHLTLHPLLSPQSLVVEESKVSKVCQG